MYRGDTYAFFGVVPYFAVHPDITPSGEDFVDLFGLGFIKWGDLPATIFSQEWYVFGGHPRPSNLHDLSDFVPLSSEQYFSLAAGVDGVFRIGSVTEPYNEFTQGNFEDDLIIKTEDDSTLLSKVMLHAPTGFGQNGLDICVFGNNTGMEHHSYEYDRYVT